MEDTIRDFRRALGQFATGVSIVSLRGLDDEPVGITVSSFNSVSLDPPLVLFSVARDARSLPALTAAKGYVCNILSAEQEHLSNRFAKPLTDKWRAVDHAPGYADAPVIAGALAHFECAPHAQYDGGDHVIIVGRVVRFAQASDAGPLVFFRGRYHSLQSHRPEPQLQARG
jgi:flavin reductase (DIM6/NTAB) family NADH-FMN oxidoreductase RutF